MIMKERYHKKETNLEEVKKVAKMFLHLDIVKTEFFPIVVKHPFTDNGVVVTTSESGEFKIADLSDEDDVKMWRKQVERYIQNTESVDDIYMMITKPYGLVFLSHISDYLSDEDFATMLANAWIRSECPNLDPNFSRQQLLKMFKAAIPTVLMDEDEYKKYAQLEEVVTVYRGVTSYNAQNIRTLSWTLDYKVADWFAHRFDEEGTVYEAQISKEHIYALFNGRNESEVIVDPKYLMNITERQEIDESIESSTSYSFSMQ